MNIRALVFALLIITVAAAFAREEETVAELISKAEAAKVEDRPGLYLRAAKLQLKAADDLYSEGKPDQARHVVEDVVTYSQKAVEAAVKSGKKLKNSEIAIRKMAERLNDIKRSLSFEDQAPVQAAVDRLQHMRTDLLSKMFSGKE
jgi:polyhydroxyalkanoate synthesis regulator phasin